MSALKWDLNVDLWAKDGSPAFLEVLKPYPHEHAARLNDPVKYSAMRRENNAFGPGIHVIWGKRKTDGKMEIQAIRFDSAKFTVEQAKKWLKDHGYRPIMFEPAIAPPKK